MATQAQKDAFKLKWHRARLMERGLSRTAIAKKMDQFRKQGRVPQAPIISRGASRPAMRPVSKQTPVASKNASPYRRWVAANNNGGKRLAPDNNKAPWRNFANNGGPRKILNALDLGHDERQARYARNQAKNKSRVSQAAVQRALRAKKKQAPARNGTVNGNSSPYRKWVAANNKPGAKRFTPDNNKSPYRAWAGANKKPGAKRFQSDNGRSPWRNFVQGNKPKPRFSQAAVQRRLRAQKKGKKAVA